MTQQNTRRGILLMIAVTFIFAVQDGVSRHLAQNYNVLMVTMIRYWFFALFCVAFAARAPGGLRRALRPKHPVLQVTRGLLLVFEICIILYAFTLLGLVETHAIFAAYPLIVAALSGPILGEKVGWRRWTAIGVGFIGMVIILRPGQQVFSPVALIPFIAATTFAVYGLLTRYVSRDDSAGVSFFWTGTIGAVVITVAGLPHWQPMTLPDWGWMAVICCTGVLSHYLLIRVYEMAEASAVQPFAYFQLPFVAVIGLTFFGEAIRPNVIIGAAIVVGAGLFTLWRERVKAARDAMQARAEATITSP